MEPTELLNAQYLSLNTPVNFGLIFIVFFVQSLFFFHRQSHTSIGERNRDDRAVVDRRPQFSRDRES